MEVIANGISDIFKLLGKQKNNDNGYHCSQFTVEFKCDNDIVLLNTLTRKIVKFNQNEICPCKSISEVFSQNTIIDAKSNFQDILKTRDYLIQEWFYLSNDIKDIELYNQIDNIFKCKEEKNFLGYRNFIIFTTTVCNANCYYCFEKGIEKVSMTDETAIEVAEYILKNRNVNEKVILSWFGGEPLCNIKAIHTITNYLKNNEVDFVSHITTNASLFGDDIIHVAKSEWNLRHAQVTLDGTENVYNSIKDYNNKEKYNYKLVIDNIFKLNDEGIHVTIRLNTNENNIDDISNLVNILLPQISNRNIFIDFHDITNSINNIDISPKSDDYWAKFYKLKYDCIKSVFKSDSEFYENLVKLYSKYRGGYCQSTSIRIYPDGKIFPCQHTLECSPIGNVREGIVDTEQYDLWKKRVIADECVICSFLPLCPALKMCPTRHSKCKAVARYIHENNVKYLLSNKKRSSTIYKQDNVIEYKLLSDYVLSIEDDKRDSNVIRLNKHAYLIWSSITDGCTINEITTRIKSEINVDEKKLSEIVSSVILNLKKLGYVCFK